MSKEFNLIDKLQVNFASLESDMWEIYVLLKPYYKHNSYESYLGTTGMHGSSSKTLEAELKRIECHFNNIKSIVDAIKFRMTHE